MRRECGRGNIYGHENPDKNIEIKFVISMNTANDNKKWVVLNNSQHNL